MFKIKILMKYIPRMKIDRVHKSPLNDYVEAICVVKNSYRPRRERSSRVCPRNKKLRNKFPVSSIHSGLIKNR